MNLTMNIPSIFRCSVWILTLLPCVPSIAQNTGGQRVVTVEKEYNPDVDKASKVDVLPENQLPSVQRKTIEYGTNVQAYRGSRYQLGPDIINQTQGETTRGYIQGGAGNYGQLDFRAGYLFKITENDELNAAASFGGTNSTFNTHPIPVYNTEGHKWENHYYRTEGNLDYSHYFKEVTFNLGANMCFDNFSYYRFLSQQGEGNNWNEYLFPVTSTNQGHRKYSVQAGLHSNEINSLPIQFTMSTAYSSFRRSRLADGNPLTENLFHTMIDASGDIALDQSLGLKLTMDNLFYSSVYSAYTALEVNPYYNFYYNGFKLHVGGKVHYNVGRGQFVQFAPDLSAEYPFFEGFSIYAELGGGHILNDFRRLELENPYWMSGSLKDSHERMNGVLGFKGNAGRTFSFNVNAGYNVTKDDICFMNIFSNMTDVAYLYAVNAKTKHFFAEGEIALHFPEIMNLKVTGKTYDWKADRSAYLVMKPKNEIGASLDFRVAPMIKFNINYNYMEHKRVLADVYRVDIPNAVGLDLSSLTPDQVSAHASEVAQTSIKMKPINNLSAGITLDVLSNFSIYAQLNNILNRKYDYYYSYPAQGINFLGGLSYRF